MIVELLMISVLMLCFVMCVSMMCRDLKNIYIGLGIWGDVGIVNVLILRYCFIKLYGSFY